MQEQEHKFGSNIPAAATILYHKEEGSYMPSCFISKPPGETDQTIALSRRQDYSLHGS
jgi:hypothetical protein